jgi:hypothetical protein
VHSPTFRTLVQKIERFEVLVYVRHSLKQSSAGGALDIIGAAHGQRMFVIFISPALSLRQSIAMIAHELQHAIEVAADPDVVDRRSLRTLYQRIGTAGVAGSYDTIAARDAGTAVLWELQAGGDLETDRSWPAVLEWLPQPLEETVDAGT